jgi:hypothetical protein
MLSVIYTNNNEEIYDANQVDVSDPNFVRLSKKVSGELRLVAMINRFEIKRIKAIQEVAKMSNRVKSKKKNGKAE